MFLEMFNVKKPIIGMLHMGGNSTEERVALALKEAAIYKKCGVDAMLIEDYLPGSTYEDVRAAMKALSQEDDYVVGVNILNNFCYSYETASLYGGKFMQVDSVAGHLPPELDKPYAEAVAAYRATGKLPVIGGVRFKYQPVLSGRTLEEDMKLGMQRCDVVACTGAGTGLETSTDKIKEYRALLGDFPMVIAAGMTAATVKEKLSIADVAIVGSYFKEGHKDTGIVKEENVREFMDKVFELREEC